MPCLITDNYRDVDNIQKYIHKAATYDGHDDRKLEDDYANSHNIAPDVLKKKFSATGKLNCNGLLATANITENSSVITSVGHTFMNPYNCKKGQPPKSCIFTYSYEGRESSIPVDSLVATGAEPCPPDPNSSADWAVLKLKSPASGPTPYRIDPEKVNSLRPPKNVVLVADHSIDFCVRNAAGKCERDKKGAVILPRFAVDCTIRESAYHGGLPFQNFNDCPASMGASGGALLDDNLDHPTLLAIFNGNQESDSDFKKERQSHSAIDHPWESRKWMGIGIPINGPFSDAIQKAVSEVEAENGKAI